MDAVLYNLGWFYFFLAVSFWFGALSCKGAYFFLFSEFIGPRLLQYHENLLYCGLLALVHQLDLAKSPPSFGYD